MTAAWGSEEDRVELVIRSVRDVLGDPTLAGMFGAPVDVKGLEGYLDAVERPMDLQTICNNASSYADYKLVLKDVRLVWQNCHAYWGQSAKKGDPTGALLLEMCEKARGVFKASLDRACRLRGVRLLDPVLAGVAHARQYFVGEGWEGRVASPDAGPPCERASEHGSETAAAAGPLKIVDLDLFHVYAEDEDGDVLARVPVDLVSMAQLRILGETVVRISGTLQAARKKSTISLSLSKVQREGEGGEQRQQSPKTIENEEVLDWVVGWSTGVGNSGTNNIGSDKRAIVYVVTRDVWYRLHRPGDAYAEMYEHVRTGVELVEVASRRAEVAGEVPDVKGLVDAVAKEMRSGLVVRLDAPDSRGDTTTRLLPRNVPAHVKKFAIGHMEGLYGQRVDALSRYGMVHFDEDGGIDDGRLERLELEMDTEVAKQKKDRGPPPEMDSRWRVPKDKVHEVLFLWGFLQEFGAILKLAPFTLGTLEAALCPGPSIDMALNELTFKEEDAKEMERIRAEAREKEKEREKEIISQPSGGGPSMATENLDPDGNDVAVGMILGPAEDNADTGECANVKTEGMETMVATQNLPKQETDNPGNEEQVDKSMVPRGETSLDVHVGVKEETSDAKPSTGTAHDTINAIDNGALNTDANQAAAQRGRGRPRKAVPELPPIPHPAPQNLVRDPTIKTRTQRGVAFNVKKFDDEFTMDVDGIFDGEPDDLEEYQPAKQRRRTTFKVMKNLSPTPNSASDACYMPEHGPAAGPTQEELAVAMKEAQRKQEEHAAYVKERYGVSLDIINKATVVDRSYAPSGVLIRDIVLALLSVVDETLVLPKGKQELARPVQASTYVARSHKLLWPAALANTVWSYDQSTEKLKETALRLAYGDFVDLSAAERIDVLCALVYEIIESPLLANIIARKADEYAQHHAVRPPWRCIKPHGVDMAQGIQKDIEQSADRAVLASLPKEGEEENDTPASPAISRPMAKWMSWLSLLGLGTLAPIGDDADGRRYWAIGEDAGAFRVFCQIINDDLCNEDSWGWYEGERLDQLVNWFKVSDIRSERPLVAALSTAPRSTSGNSTKLIESSRHDGYRSITSPLLRGEFNHCNTKPASLTMDQRSSRAVEVMLGSISFWFDAEMTKKVIGISDILLKGQPTACSKVLLETDKLLIDSGRTSQEWVDLWSPNWRKTAVALSSTLDILLHVSALQKHVRVEEEMLSRIVFLKVLDEMHTNQSIPLPDDEVAVSKTIALHHIDKAMELLGFTKKAGTRISLKLPSPDPGTEGATTALEECPVIEDDAAAEILGMLADRTNKSFLETDICNPLIREEALDKVRAQWQGLRDQVMQMKRIEQYTVRCVTYRKSLIDSSDLKNTENVAEDLLSGIKRPVAWVTLKPATYALPSETSTAVITVPLVLDKELEDFCPSSKEYKRSMKVGWMPGDRFKTKATGWASGWRKGTVLDNYAPHNLYIPGSRDSGLDPCHSILVSFDDGPAGNEERVSPWKLQIDSEEERQIMSQCNKLEKSVERTLRRASSGAFSDKQASIKQLELAAQQAELEEAKQRKQRAEELLAKAAAFKDDEGIGSPLEVPNTAYYGSNIQEQHTNYLYSIGDQLYGKYAATSVSTKSRAKSDTRAERITAYPTGPLTQGQQVPDDILDTLRLLPKEQFLIMLENFYIGLKGRFKTPTFAHRELDLHRVWWSVMDRYGYENVCASKQWRDVAKSLGVNLTGQTSASFNMRLNYERCLLDFENYLCCGQYDKDLANNSAPVHTHRTDPATTRFVIPGAYVEEQMRLEAAKARQIAMERSSKDASVEPEAAKSTATGTTGKTGAVPKTAGLSLKLKLSVPLKSPDASNLAGGGSNIGSNVVSPNVVSPTSPKLKIKLKSFGPSGGGSGASNVAGAGGTGGAADGAGKTGKPVIPQTGTREVSEKGPERTDRGVAERNTDMERDARHGLDHVPAPANPPSPPSGALPTPVPSFSTPDPESLESGLAALTAAAAAARQSKSPEPTPHHRHLDLDPENLGPSLQSMGINAIGVKIQLHWPSEGGWWNAEIISYDDTNGEHQIVYNKGAPDESFEWTRLDSLNPGEIRRI